MGAWGERERWGWGWEEWQWSRRKLQVMEVLTFLIMVMVSWSYIPVMCVCVLSCFSRVWLFVTSWTVARQAPLSMGFSRQEYQSGWPCPSPGDLPNPGNESLGLLCFLHGQSDSLPLSHLGSPTAQLAIHQLHFNKAGKQTQIRKKNLIKNGQKIWTVHQRE